MIGKNKVFAYLLVGILIAVLTAVGQGATITWTADDDGDWSNQLNWSPQQVPGPDDDVVHDGTGAGVIRVNITNAACKTFTATAGGSPLRGLRIMPSMKLTVGTPGNPNPPGPRQAFRVLGQTEQVRYLTELKVFAELQTLLGDGFGDDVSASSGDLLLLPHSLVYYGGSYTYLRGAVWTLRGGRFWTNESDLGPIGVEGQGGKIVVEQGGSFNSRWADSFVDQIEVQPGGTFWGAHLEPQVKISATACNLGIAVLDLTDDDTESFDLGPGTFGAHPETGMTVIVGAGKPLRYHGIGGLLEVASLSLRTAEPTPTDGGVLKPDAPGATLRLSPTDAVEVFTRGAAFKDWDARGVTLVAPEKPTGPAPPPTKLEAYYPDLGPYLFQDVPCSHWAELYLERSGILQLRDDQAENFHHGSVATKDAVYVRGSLVMKNLATLDLNGLNLYHAGALAETGFPSIQSGGGAVIEVYALNYGDFDGDGDVDSADYVGHFQPAYGGSGNPTNCPLADADCDTDVDLADYVKFQANYTGSNPTLPPVGMAPCPTGDGGSEGGPEEGSGEPGLGIDQSPVERHAAWVLAHFDRTQIQRWVGELRDRAGRAATPEQRAELEELATLLANGVGP